MLLFVRARALLMVHKKIIYILVGLLLFMIIANAVRTTFSPCIETK